MEILRNKYYRSKDSQDINQPKPDTSNKKRCPPRSRIKQVPKGVELIGQPSSRGTFSLAIQNLEFPDASILQKKPEHEGKCFIGKKTKGVDITSSSNTHYKDAVMSVKHRPKMKCTSSSTMLKTTRTTSTLSDINGPKSASRQLLDTEHEPSQPGKKVYRDTQWKKPCTASFVAGAPRPFIGVCTPTYEQLAKMSKPRQKFFLTQDPRKTHCLVNPEVLTRKIYTQKEEFEAVTKMVKHADNTCAGTESDTSESFICEVVDLDNPMQLDFQGMDYKNTYERDEQELQNHSAYWRVLRYMDRKRTKAETKANVEAELQEERLNVPPCFKTDIVDVIPEPPIEEDPQKHGKLYRSPDKPYNKRRIEHEREERRQRYKDIYLHDKERQLEQIRQNEEKLKKEQEVQAFKTAADDFQKVMEAIDIALERKVTNTEDLKPPERKRRIFPHTMNETTRFKKKLKHKNRITRDESIVKRDFFQERLNVKKPYPEADLEISEDSAPASQLGATPPEQSSDDEDNMKVGKDGDVFKLRGFHFKLGDSIRGKLHQSQLTDQRKEKGCLTREQWLKELAPKKELFKSDVDPGVTKLRSADDPELELFPPQRGLKWRRVEYSAVHDYVQKRLGRHYERTLRKNVKLARPRLQYSVKKFNMIKFRYGETDKQLTHLQEPNMALGEHTHLKIKMNSTLAYMQAKQKQQQERMKQEKLKRMKLLGLPCREVHKSRLQTDCENSETESIADWVPQPEQDYAGDIGEEMNHIYSKGNYLPVPMRGNMPAPLYRETTFHVHPRRPRDYAGERVPSQLFYETVQTSGKPLLEKIKPDDIQFANVRLKKRPFTDKFGARHHHDHWNPTDTKKVNVHYRTKVVKPEITHIKEKKNREFDENFKMADPPCNAYVGMDLTVPHYDFKAMIKAYNDVHKTASKVATKERTQDFCQPYDFVYHSRPAGELDELDFPGRQEYLQFLQEVRETLYEAKDVDPDERILLVDRDAIVKELEEDLKSIESCLTSLSSSQCTNLTDDSGSFLLMEGVTKVPLDYIRKPLVPFEELQRSRFQAKIIDVDKEEANPFKCLPFSGQLKEQVEMNGGKDSFFTFNSRLKNGLRLRLEVPVEDVRQKLLGRGEHKYYGAVITDIDENYIEELRSRPPVRSFNFKTGIILIKDALRMKFESLLIHGQIVRTKIYDRLNDQHWEEMKQMKLLYEKLFTKWEKREYETAMNVVYQVKSYYERTDRLKREFRELERELMMLNMDIVFIEGHWIRCIMLQNFHYLLGDQEWREEHDWIHRVRKRRLTPIENGENLSFAGGEDEEGEEEDIENEEYELENFEESILKRGTVNIRMRDKDDAWAIRAFYYDVFVKNQHPILQVFPNADSFLKGIDNLKTKTFVLLLELHFTLSIHTELLGRLETFMDWCTKDLIEKEEYVARKSAKKFFMEARAMEMEQRTLQFLDHPIEESFNDEEYNKSRAVISEVWRQIVPTSQRGSSDHDPMPADMVAMISDVVMELLGKFEQMDIDKIRKTEIHLRHRRLYLQKQSFQAYQIERRIEIEMKKVRRNLEPPFQRPKKVGKLPRLYIKKIRRPTPIPEKHISEHTKFFIRAFHEDGETELVDARESLMVIDTIQEQIVPFYFDHFLRLNGYTPNYNFKTQVEIRDGPEMKRFQIREVIPDVEERMKAWEALKKKTMEENISRNPKMYENVM